LPAPADTRSPEQHFVAGSSSDRQMMYSRAPPPPSPPTPPTTPPPPPRMRLVTSSLDVGDCGMPLLSRTWRRSAREAAGAGGRHVMRVGVVGDRLAPCPDLTLSGASKLTRP